MLQSSRLVTSCSSPILLPLRTQITDTEPARFGGDRSGFSDQRPIPDRLVCSDAVIDKAGEELRADDELPPLRVELCGGLRGNHFVDRFSLGFQSGDVPADIDEHRPVVTEFGLLAQRLAVTRYDDRLVGDAGEDFLDRLDLAIDPAPGRIVYKRINAVPVQVSV